MLLDASDREQIKKNILKDNINKKTESGGSGKDSFTKMIKNKNNVNKGINNMETIGNKNIPKINPEIIALSQTDEDIQNMDYEEAIIHDKRSYLRMYWSFLVDSQIILGTFCTENYLNLLIIKLSFLISTFQISFFLNAFFYTDEYISDAYHNEGMLDFFTGLPKSIYSFVATLITTNLLKMLSNSKSELMQVIRENRKNNNYINLIDIKLKKLKRKLIIYFIFVFLLGLLFLYYVSAFCAVYIYSQKFWFLGCLESLAIDTIVCGVLCLLVAFLRYISIKKRIRVLYIISNIISTIL
jgi:hypothetical protein